MKPSKKKIKINVVFGTWKIHTAKDGTRRVIVHKPKPDELAEILKS